MMKNIFLIIVLVLFVYGCEQTENTSHKLQINRLENSDLVSRACATSFVLDNQAYVLFGRKFGNELLQDIYVFNPATENWNRKNDFPGDARVFPVSAVVNQRAYAGLGFNGNRFSNPVLQDSAYLRDWWMYDQSSDSWIRKADYPDNFTNHAVAFCYHDEIYILHGFGLLNFSQVFYKYNPFEDKWIKLNSFPGYARTCAVGVSNGERIFSGTGFATWNEKDWWEYYPENDVWKKLKNMPDKGRINATAFSIANRIFVSSGRFFKGEHDGGHLKNDILEYDLNENKWYYAGELPEGERENAISFVIDGKAYIAFGEGNSGIILNDIWRIETP
jgi:N-acetylneuraminic acid mutarotase